MNKVRNIEDLSTDMFNDDFIRIFQPIFYVLQVLGLLRVNIKYRYPTAPSRWYHLYSNSFWIMNTFCVAFFFLRCENSFGSPHANSSLKLGILMNGINGVLIVLRNNLRSGNKIGLMYVKLQKMERFLNMKNSKSLNKQLERQSTFTVLSACFFTILWVILYKTVFMTNMCIPLMVIMTTGVGLHTETVEVYFIIQLMNTRVNYVNDILRQEAAGSEEPIIDESINDGKLFYIVNPSDNPVNEVPGELVSAMHCIFEALADFKELFQLSLFYFVCQILAWNLVSIYYLVSSLKEQKAAVADFDLVLCVLPLLLNKQFLMLTLCLKAESLSTKLEESRKLCIDIVSSSLIDGKSREHAKQIILLVEGRRSVSIYNICTLGTRLPLHLLAVTASYTVVLLQIVIL